MMDKLIEEVKILVDSEYGRAGAKFGLTNHSDHESYAVLLEEREEAHVECAGVDRALNYLWDLIKRNAPDEEKLEVCKNLEARAVLAASEFIQVAAMAKKAALTVCDRNIVVDLIQRSGGEST